MQFLSGWRAVLLTLLVAVSMYLSLWLVFDRAVMPPSTSFSITTLFLCGAAAGLACFEYLRLPVAIGMLCAGVLLANTSMAFPVDRAWSSVIRLVTLAVIMLRAGLGLEWTKVKATITAALLLTTAPAVAEATLMALLARPLLGFPWLWCWLLALANTGVSPAVIVPLMSDVRERGYGVQKGIPTLLVTAASLNDILVIVAFTVLLGKSALPHNSSVSAQYSL
jgi:solute carrier family 9B (sodium/hydrogen exchanger), member 1/2